MKTDIRLNFNNFPYISILLVFVSLNIVSLLTIFILRNYLPPQIPLYYGKPLSEETLGSTLSLAIPPTLSLVFSLINSFIVTMINKNSFLQKTLVVGSITSIVFALVTTIKTFVVLGSF